MVTVTVGGRTKKILLSFKSLQPWPEALSALLFSRMDVAAAGCAFGPGNVAL